MSDSPKGRLCQRDIRPESLHHHPQKFDAVLGNQTPIANSLILGGLAGVKARSNSDRLQVKILALKEAMNYGDPGLDLVVRSLDDPAPQIVETAYELLKDRSEPFVRDRIERYLDDRELEIEDMKYSWLESSPVASIQKQFKPSKASKSANSKTASRAINTPSKNRWNSAS
jgi:hypothetical protein